MRKITEHECHASGHTLDLFAEDDPSFGGASHQFSVQSLEGSTSHLLYFQKGPIKEVGANGITNEILLAIVLDRLRAFQGSEYACRENAIALTKLEEVLMWLHRRTQSREDRGVEGTHGV